MAASSTWPPIFTHMPFLPDAFDTAMMVRVMHHVDDVPGLLDQVARVLVDGGTYVLEFASKRHLKAMLRYALGKQDWSPFDQTPIEFVEMNFDFHPAWMRERLAEAGFHVKHQRTVSHFRLPLLKRLVPPSALARLDGLCQPTGAWWQLTPSVFVQCALGDGAGVAPAKDLSPAPPVAPPDLLESPEAMACHGCDRRWPIEDGIYNFKSPSPECRLRASYLLRTGWPEFRLPSNHQFSPSQSPCLRGRPGESLTHPRLNFWTFCSIL